MRISIISVIALVLVGCSLSHGGVSDSGPSDRADSGPFDLFDAGASDDCRFAPLCVPPPEGCQVVDVGPCDCGTLVCADSALAFVDAGPDSGFDCPELPCPLPPPGEGCQWVPTGIGCCGFELVCDPCEGDRFLEFDTTCQQDSDCAIGLHQIDCCGSQQAMGMNQSAVGVFEAGERQCVPPAACACIPEPTGADDGTSGREFEVGCSSLGVCVTTAL